MSRFPILCHTPSTDFEFYSPTTLATQSGRQMSRVLSEITAAAAGYRVGRSPSYRACFMSVPSEIILSRLLHVIWGCTAPVFSDLIFLLVISCTVIVSPKDLGLRYRSQPRILVSTALCNDHLRGRSAARLRLDCTTVFHYPRRCAGRAGMKRYKQLPLSIRALLTLPV